MKKIDSKSATRFAGLSCLAFLLCAALLLSLAGCALIQEKAELKLQDSELYQVSETSAPPLLGATSAAKPRPGSETTKPSASPKSKNSKAAESSRKATKSSVDTSREFDCGDLSRLAGTTLPVSSLQENNAAFADLDQRLRAYLDSCGLGQTEIGLIYDDLAAGMRYSYQPDQRVMAASVIKVAMAMVCAQLIQEGVFPEDMMLTYLPGEQFSSDNLDSSRVGQLVPLKELLASAVMYSDNTATSVVFHYFHRHGRDIHGFMDERCGTHYSGDITMSAREGANLVNTLVAQADRYPMYREILEWMTASSWSSFLTAGIPVPVAHKYGNLCGSNNEIGLVYGNKQFIYSVFTNNVPAYQLLPQLGAFLYSYSSGEPFTPVPVSLPAFIESEPSTSESEESSTGYPTYTPPPPTEPTPMPTVMVDHEATTRYQWGH